MYTEMENEGFEVYSVMISVSSPYAASDWCTTQPQILIKIK
jgi:hypothetical protein